MHTLFDLSGRTALVTGGNSGLGLGIAQALASAGASVVLVARRDGELRAACATVPGKASYVCADLSQRASLADVARAAAAPFGAPDIVVHAAGVNLRQPIDAIDDASWDVQIELMLAAPFFLSRHLVPAMRAKKWGRIIHLASLQTQRAFPDSAPYGAAKGGIAQLTRAMAEAWSRDGINVNAIAPGYFRTPLTEPVMRDPQRAAELAARTMIGRNGLPEDLAGTAIWLASRASDYVTGQVIYVDGGFTAKG